VRQFSVPEYERPLLPAFAPCGRWLYAHGGGLVAAWDLAAAGSEPAWVDDESAGFLFRLVVSPCGRYLAGSEDRCVLVWDLAGRGPARWIRASTSGDHILDVAFAPDGTDLLTACIGEGVQRWRTGTWRRKRPFATRSDCDGPLALSPDGRTVATVHAVRDGEGARVKLWQYPRGTYQRTGARSAGSVRRLAFSPDGTVLVTNDDQAGVLVWDARTLKPVAEFTPRRARKAKRPSAPVTHFAFHPSGQYLAAAGESGTVEFVETTTWRTARAFDWKIGPVYGVAFARDGTLAAAGGKSGQVVVWDVDP
jgi:WD40 repeat protein